MTFHNKSALTAYSVKSLFPATPFVLNSRRMSVGTLMVVVWCALFFATNLYAQERDHTENTPDTALRSTARVDPSTLGMSIRIPLGGYPGRAGNSLPVVLTHASKVWGVNYEDTRYNESTGARLYDLLDSAFGQHSVAGWVSNFSIPRIKWPQFEKYSSGGTPGECGPGTGSPACYYISRFHVYMPDGSSHELRKDDLARTSLDKTGTFYAVDGSRLKFEASTNTLWMPDGSRYIFNPTITFNEQVATQYIDRNGNTININSSAREWTDTLGRILADPLPVGPAPGGLYDYGYDPNRPPAGDHSYMLPGVGGTTKTLIFRWRRLADVLTPDPTTGQVPALRYRGDFKSTYLNPGMPPPHLFTSNGNMRIAVEEQLFNPVVLHEIAFPNGSTYKFTYNEYGEINKILYPTGGYERFVYGKIPSLSTVKFASYREGNRGVLSRWLSPSGLPADEQPWLYSASLNSSYYLITMTAPDNTRTERYMHRSPDNIYFGFDDARAGMAYEERVYSAANVMLRRSLTQWAVSGPTPGGHSSATRDARVTKGVNILLDTGAAPALAATALNRYEQVSQPLNLTSLTEYGYESVDQTTAQTAGIESFNPIDSFAIRTTETAYLDSGDYTARNLVSLPISITIRSGMPVSGVVKARSEMLYDEPSFAPLPCGASVGWGDPGTSARANVTTTREWLDTLGAVTDANAYLAAHMQYDNCGSLRKIWDRRDTTLSNPAQIEYSSTHQFAYPTVNTSPDPDGGGPLLPLMTSTEYDASTGLVTAATDANGQRTTFAYNDPLNRLKQVIRAAGDASAKNQSFYAYDDVAHTITVTSDLNTYDDNVLKKVTLYDGIGRTTETRTFEGGTNYIAVQQQYDVLGRVFKTSNPFRPWQSETPVWTINGYDALSRVLTVTTPDNAVVVTNYSGNLVTVTDQAGKARKSVSDALGRLKEVYEDPSGLNYLTSYAYDALDSLTTVTQGIQTRSFGYDSLKRLTTASNPESGAINYQYDNNGNLTQKTDARVPPVTTSYIYDALNRVTNRNYSDGTPAVTYGYDAAAVANSKGRLTSVTSTVSTYSYGAYDVLGRVKTGTQTTDGQSYSMSYSYDLAGNLKTQTYPSGRVVVPEYDSAGRLAGVKNQASGPFYAGAVASDTTNRLQYSAHGAISQMRLGNTLWEHTNFNSRLQPTQIGLGTASSNSSVLQLDYSYGTTANNGNVLSQTIVIPGLTLSQAYTYDQLNRLETSNENAGASWKQKFQYDRYGNRRIDSDPANTSPDLVGPNPVLSEANNRIVAQTGEQYQYDAAGNLMRGRDGQTYAFDAENKMTSFNGVGASYSYDGDGKRVKKVVGTVTTVFVYDVSGRLVAEYSSAAPQGNGTRYLTADHLGSPRVITDSAGVVKGRHDYLPFGEEVGLRGGRSDQNGYVGDTVRQKFTRKERDNETGLDYSINRYYSSTQGRFTGADPLSGEPKRPQSWNRYSYVLNNPLRFIDPDGLRWLQRTVGDGTIAYGWCATEECYNNAIDTKSKDYAGWTAVTFDETQPYEYDIAGGGGDRFDRYQVNPDGTHGCTTCGSMSTHWEAQFAIGGLLRGAMSGLGRAMAGLFSQQAATTAGGEVLTGLYGKVTAEALESAAASGGPTVQVFTRLTQAPAVGKTLSVAYDKAGAMAARSAGELYKAELPRALVDQLKRSGLAFEKKLVWEGGKKVHTELQIMPQATKFVTQYFK